MPELCWITGAGGLIGSHVVAAARPSSKRWQVRALGREQLDLTEFKTVEQQFRAERPTLVIHCAALTRSPLCQSDPKRAWQINVRLTEHLAGLAAECAFIFFSTDLVFDGRAGFYQESAAVNPLSVYGETKAAAEQVVLANANHTVIRTSLTAGSSPTGDRGLDEQLKLAWARGEKTRLFTDEYRCPIPAISTARAVWELAGRQLSGLFHLAGAERLSRWEIGQLIAEQCPELNPSLEPASFPLPRFTEWAVKR
jgi:dTDP-4-dehydrorhamnose reductase